MRTWTFTWKKYFGEEEAYAGGLDPLQSQKGTDMAEFNFPPQHKLQKVKISLLICCVETFLFRNFYLADCNQHFCSITSIYPLLSRCLMVQGFLNYCLWWFLDTALHKHFKDHTFFSCSSAIVSCPQVILIHTCLTCNIVFPSPVQQGFLGF